MKKYWYGFWMCFGMFCAIPCPCKIWDETARPRMIACLPLVGGIIGGLWALCAWLLSALAAPVLLQAAILTVLPFLLTGMIHLDGFMDCCDAILSRRDLPTRQAILKDSHTGAFAVICFGFLLLLTFALWAEKDGSPALPALLCIPVVSRACAAAAVTLLRPMGHSQYAGSFQQNRRASGLALPVLLLCAGCGLPVWLCGLPGLAPAAAAGGYWLAVWYGTRQLGGMSGDVSGFGLTVGEFCGLAALLLL